MNQIRYVFAFSVLWFTVHSEGMDHQKGVASNLYHAMHQGFSDLRSIIFSQPNNFYQSFLLNHTHRDIVAQVRIAPEDQLCSEEIQAMYLRRALVKKGLENLLDIKIDNASSVPTIAFCGSGGGFRSMVLTIGFLQGAQDCGLLDCFSYMAGLSGSTWAIAPWIASGNSLSTYYDTMKENIKDGINHFTTSSEMAQIINRLLEKVVYGQRISLIDLYGGLLANTLLSDFKEKRLAVTLSQTHAATATGKYPLPLYTTISTNAQPYEWFEVTPFEIGSPVLQSYVPLWSYGRFFNNGFSVNSVPEQTLGYFLGTFGSAFEVDLEDVVRIFGDKLRSIAAFLPKKIAEKLDNLIHVLAYEVFDEVRLFPAICPNFTLGMDHYPAWGLEKDIALVDAGIDFNLALPPLLREARTVDCIIVYDATAGVAPGEELRKAQDYALRKGLPFPVIDYSGIDKKLVSVFKDECNPHCPVVVYFPLLPNPDYSSSFDPIVCMESGYCGTFNFKYGAAQIDELSGLARFTVNQYKELLVRLIRDCVEQKK